MQDNALYFAEAPSASLLKYMIANLMSGGPATAILSGQNLRGIEMHLVPEVGVIVQAVCKFPAYRTADIIADLRVKLSHNNAHAFTVPFSAFEQGGGIVAIQQAAAKIFSLPRSNKVPERDFHRPYLYYAGLTT